MWDEISMMLEEERAEVGRLLARAQDEVTLRQLQGRAQFLDEFETLVREAPALLEKARVSTL